METRINIEPVEFLDIDGNKFFRYNISGEYRLESTEKETSGRLSFSFMSESKNESISKAKIALNRMLGDLETLEDD